MDRIRVLIAPALVISALLMSNTAPAVELDADGASTHNPAQVQSSGLISQGLDFSMQGRKSTTRVWPPYPPAPGEEWIQVTPWLWHYYKEVDDTSHVEKWYTMGREGLEWRVENLIMPRIQDLESKLTSDPGNKSYQAALTAYRNRLQQISQEMGKVGSYYSDPDAIHAPDSPTSCNYAVTSASIGSTQITGSGQACSTSGDSTATYYEWYIWRGGGWEHNSDYNPYWSAFGVSRAKIPDYVCRVESYTGAWWGPFWWDRQDSDEWAEDSDCK